MEATENVHEEKTAKEIPDYLKQRLKARGILKDEKAVSNCPAADNASLHLDFLKTSVMCIHQVSCLVQL